MSVRGLRLSGFDFPIDVDLGVDATVYLVELGCHRFLGEYGYLVIVLVSAHASADSLNDADAAVNLMGFSNYAARAYRNVARGEARRRIYLSYVGLLSVRARLLRSLRAVTRARRSAFLYDSCSVNAVVLNGTRTASEATRFAVFRCTLYAVTREGGLRTITAGECANYRVIRVYVTCVEHSIAVCPDVRSADAVCAGRRSRAIRFHYVIGVYRNVSAAL